MANRNGPGRGRGVSSAGALAGSLCCCVIPAKLPSLSETQRLFGGQAPVGACGGSAPHPAPQWATRLRLGCLVEALLALGRLGALRTQSQVTGSAGWVWIVCSSSLEG